MSFGRPFGVVTDSRPKRSIRRPNTNDCGPTPTGSITTVGIAVYIGNRKKAIKPTETKKSKTAARRRDAQLQVKQNEI
ncbi:hypothetical protein ACFVKB_22205, partial [Rhodococcus sp. NPDC127530]|uniref:hypothetical protein n=1 Tax=Rhodococcus sp. NPDC127530 TaxID=3345397 RepID=UPI003631F2F3